MRLKGEGRLDETKEARWEFNGQISILKTKTSKPVRKKECHLFN